jgi:hypothetical protein
VNLPLVDEGQVVGMDTDFDRITLGAVTRVLDGRGDFPNHHSPLSRNG